MRNKPILKLRIQLSLIIILIIIFIGLNFLNEDKLSNFFFQTGLNSNNSEIIINTPQNKTYYSAMSGYYPGSFGFENVLLGTIPEGWYTRSSGSGYYEIDHLLAGHYNVYEIRKSGGTNKVETYKILPQSATSGTVEFWLYKDTDSGIDPTRITLRDDPTGGYIPFGIENGDLFIGAWSEKAYTFNNAFTKNEWHHIRVDFNLAIGWQIKIDDTWYGEGYAFTAYASDHPAPSQINTFHVESIYSGDNPSYGAWFDAVSYSWDPSYNIGDNLEEGLLISYSTSIEPDWQAYSLDGQANVTILGNTTINLPEIGLHSIKISCNNTLGDFYSSEIRYFSFEFPDIELFTPENKTYTSTMDGYYLGSFGFESDLPSTIPEGWWTRSSGDGYYEVDDLLNGHYNVYEIRKSGGTMKVETYKILPQSATVGTIEFWVYKDTDSSTDPTRITLRDDPTGGYIPFGIENGDLFIGAWSEKIYTYSNVFTKNVWHHIRVDFDLAIGWQLKLDDIWYGEGYAFDVYASDHPDPSQINTFHVESIYSGDNPSYGAWFDAVSYSWDPNYNIGDNLEEGLLISYSTSIEPDWQAYSLDGQSNITITGSKTISMPNDGIHKIQISANDSIGYWYQSEIRFFSIDLNAPDITINIPIENTFFSLISPNFSLIIEEPFLNATWYTLDGGFTNIEFTGSTGNINQGEWNLLSDGPVTLRFYANDSLGQTSYSEVSINKDATIPVLIINQPLDLAVFTGPPIFNLTILELNIESKWYTVSGGVDMYIFTNPIGAIDSVAWAALSDGPVTIRFYIRDLAGNQVFQEVTIIKQTATPPPGIPGYNLYLLLGIIFIVSIILIHKRKKA